ncbi:MAG: FIST C-terminal domain-containing protein [Azonexus sp.]|nr:FIST C-terminal domain-containing protein [Azonexus sp.]
MLLLEKFSIVAMLIRHFPVINSAACSAWLDELAASNPRPLIFAHLPETEKPWVAWLQNACNQRQLDLFGAIFPALLTEQGFTKNGANLLASFNAAAHFLVSDLATDHAAAAGKIAEILANQGVTDSDGKQHQLFMIFDSTLPNIGSILAKLFDRLKRSFAYTGVNAGSETFQPMPCLFDNQRLVGGGVAGLILEKDRRIAVQHGYPIAKSLMRASSTVGNRIDRIDGQLAMTAYQRVIAADFGIELTPENFYDYAVHYPFGLVGSLEVLVRIPVAFNEDGSIFCVGEVPPNSMLRLLKAPALAASNCVRALVRQLGPSAGTPLLTYYCAGRRLHFGDNATAELQELKTVSGASSLYGALSLGEISTDGSLGIPEFHNAALVCLS